MDSLSVIAAKAALVHYARLPDRGKPSLENDEFSVLSAMVGIELDDKGDETCRQPVATVFSMATGTKCCGQGLYTQADCDGNIVCDSHSEVLAQPPLVAAVEVPETRKQHLDNLDRAVLAS